MDNENINEYITYRVADIIAELIKFSHFEDVLISRKQIEALLEKTKSV